MSDLKRRLNERMGKGVEVLTGKLRCGELTAKAVKLAASLGHVEALILYPSVDLVEWAKITIRQDVILASGVSARLLAADYAERVLHIFENKFPDDNRPREAIEAARRGGAQAADVWPAAAAVWSAVWSADEAAEAAAAGWAAMGAADAVWAAGANAAASAANAASWAAGAASWGAGAASWAANYASIAAGDGEHEYQRLRLAELILKEVK